MVAGEPAKHVSGRDAAPRLRSARRRWRTLAESRSTVGSLGAQAFRSHSPGFGPANGSAYSLLTKNKENPENKYRAHRKGNYEQHSEELLYRVENHASPVESALL